MPKLRGFVLVLVVTDAQAADPHACLARVCRDFDAETAVELEQDVIIAALQAGNQLRDELGREPMPA